MANPQKEQGSTMIANEVLESLYRFLSGNNEIRIILFIIRKTWGWHKKEDKISYNQIAKATNIPRRNVIRVVNKLVAKKTLFITKGYINIIQFNKNYDEWIVAKKTLVSNIPLPSGKKDTRVVSNIPLKLVAKKTPTKDNKDTITKENIQKIIQPINENDLIEIADKYKVPLNLVKLSKEKMDNWLEAKGKRYKNYKAGLRNWVLRDAESYVQKSMGDPTKRGVDATNV